MDEQNNLPLSSSPAADDTTVPASNLLNQQTPMTGNQLANQGVPAEVANQITEAPVTTESTTTTPPVQPPTPTPNTPAPNTPAPTQEQTFGKSELLDAQSILRSVLGMNIGNIVADLGAGGGLFSLTAARIVGDQGQVYAVDIIKNSLSEIESKARMAGLYNIKSVWSNLEILGATKIPEASLDFAMIVNVLFQSKKHFEVMSEATRLLKPGGKLLIIDWSDTSPGFAPATNMRVDKNKLVDNSGQINLLLDKEFKAGEYHFGLIFIKQ
jgi:SAM-dependent methyltransferase